MSRILHNKLRFAPSTKSWSTIDKRAVAFSIWTGRSMLLRKPISVSNGNTIIVRRKYGMLVVRAVRGILKLRYLVLGGAISGGMTLNKKYTEWKTGLPDMGWVNELLPDNQQWERFTSTLITAKDSITDKIEIDPRLTEAGRERLDELRGWLSRRYDDAVAAAAEMNRNSIEDSKGQIVSHAIASKPAPQSRDSSARTAAEERVVLLQEEVLALQARYQRELERLEQENRVLRQQNMLLKQGRTPTTKKLKKSLIDMYSSVLDELSGWEPGTDHLPRVVVVGDQSAGKTSVLEMIAQARIFPRGAGEMMTRAPVKVTLSEGPYHVAQFRDSGREFDLTKESDLADLRKEVETRMRNSVRGGRTVSTDVISMSVRGPGLHRMVLVDLPGVISTQTVDMASDTRDSIRKMTQSYMENPNAIILCIQDGSVDAERSNVTDLVSSCDPTGKRTIFVLTKVDLAEENLTNPNRIRRILEGKLFPMKALGYYAVVTGRSKKDDSISAIRDYEEQFFKTSKLFNQGLVTAGQVTTRNLSLAVAQCFWRMVRDSVEQQADSFKARRFNLETEWKNTFPRQRELDRDELFERARAELLDQSAELSSVPAAHWESKLNEALWKNVLGRVFSQIYLPAACDHDVEPVTMAVRQVKFDREANNGGTKSIHSVFDLNKFNTMVDIKLREWAESELPAESVNTGREVLGDEFKSLLERSKSDTIYSAVKTTALDEALGRHNWEDRAAEVLRVLQLNALQDRCVKTRAEWDAAIQLMDTSLTRRLHEVQNELNTLTGPGLKDRWLYWQSTTPEQTTRALIKSELEALKHDRPNMTYDQIAAVRDNLRRRNLTVDNEAVREIWRPLYLRNFLQGALNRAQDCRKSFYLYHQQNGEGKECCEVVMFWRVQQTLKMTANALRQQITNREASRLDKELREVLDEMAVDSDKKKELISGRRVELAEELKRVRQVQEKLEEFIDALSKEKQ